MDTIIQFEEDLLSVLNNYPKDSLLLAGVSGGADSMAMLAALCAAGLRERLVCMHVEHGLRPAEESRGDADFVRNFCKTNEIECKVKHIPQGKIAAFAQRKGIGIEAAARFYRHRALRYEAGQLGKNTLILLAHTKDDLLETVLMRILRGSGPSGLAAMPEKRGQILRPILGASREDVIRYLKAKNITWREDSTNTDEKFLRNRIRRRLVPLLNDAFPSWKTNLHALAQTQSLTAEFISKEADKYIKWIEKEFSLSTEDANFFAQPQIVREEAVFQAINTLLPSASSAPPREILLNLSIKRSVVRHFCEGSVNAADLGPVKIRRERENITISTAKKDFFECGISRLLK
ncbi:MAG: tRNA lysidine(34) synthetase TilS [Treponema sp.]|nr:tRNA lysidine(34) synthetase TilS [Treponema sp.]